MHEGMLNNERPKTWTEKEIEEAMKKTEETIELVQILMRMKRDFQELINKSLYEGNVDDMVKYTSEMNNINELIESIKKELDKS